MSDPPLLLQGMVVENAPRLSIRRPNAVVVKGGQQEHYIAFESKEERGDWVKVCSIPPHSERRRCRCVHGSILNMPVHVCVLHGCMYSRKSCERIFVVLFHASILRCTFISVVLTLGETISLGKSKS